MDKLKPCPFCGSEDIDTDVVENGMYTAFCNSCNAFGPLATLLAEKAIDAWNTRTSDALLSDLAEVEVPDEPEILHCKSSEFVKYERAVYRLAKTMRPLVERAKKFRGTDKV